MSFLGFVYFLFLLDSHMPFLPLRITTSQALSALPAVLLNPKQIHQAAVMLVTIYKGGDCGSEEGSACPSPDSQSL